jgi:hypothetical protein
MNDAASLPNRLDYRNRRGRRTHTRLKVPGAICNDATQRDSLPTCNEKTSFRMRLCSARSSHFSRAKFILNFPSNGEQSLSQNPAMTLGLFETEKGK